MFYVMTAVAFAASIGGAWIGVHRWVLARARLASPRLGACGLTELLLHLLTGYRKYARLGCQIAAGDSRGSGPSGRCEGGDTMGGRDRSPDAGFPLRARMPAASISCDTFPRARRGSILCSGAGETTLSAILAHRAPRPVGARPHAASYDLL